MLSTNAVLHDRYPGPVLALGCKIDRSLLIRDDPFLLIVGMGIHLLAGFVIGNYI